MAKKTMLPMPTSQGSILPKLVGTLVTIAVLIFVVKHPSESANFVKTAAEAISTFFQQVSG